MKVTVDMTPDVRTEMACFLPHNDSLKVKGCVDYRYRFFPNSASKNGTLHMFAGIPGSGKTTIRNALVEHFKENQVPHEVISLDDIRDKIGGRDQYNDYESSIENQVLEQGKTLVQQCLYRHKHCIYDATNITNEQRRFFLETALNMNANVFINTVNVHPEVAVYRDARRPTRSVGRNLILNKYNHFMSDDGFKALFMERSEAKKHNLSMHVGVVESPITASECNKIGVINPLNGTCNITSINQLPISEHADNREKWQL